MRIGFAHYRSVGCEPVWLDLTKKINVLIGANNSGKSNVFRALNLVKTLHGTPRELEETERHQRDGTRELIVFVRANVTTEDIGLSPFDPEVTIGLEYTGESQDVVCSPFTEMPFRPFAVVFRKFTNQEFTRELNADEMKSHKEHVARLLVRKIAAQLPTVHIVPDIRKIESGDQYAFGGQGIINTLAAWQIPKLGQEDLEKKFERLNALLQRLLRTPNVSLEVPPERDVIIVRRDGLRLPLTSYGTGIHELIIMAIAVFAHNDALFCIEEPEIHLHPLLQKEFLRFLVEETGNRYVLSTHSHALMVPSDSTNVVHLWAEDGVTRSRTVESTQHSLEVLRDLGVDASDLLQARSVIWVEGPSDRIYINRWLALVAPELKEGVDYSIMFYGGRLLSHLSLERDGAEGSAELIALLRINQHSAIVIDSDRKKTSDPLNATKERVRKECKTSGLICWITDGREIENYLPGSAIAQVYAETTKITKPIAVKRYGRLEGTLKKAFGKEWRSKWSYDDAKVSWARKIAPKVEAKDISPGLNAMVASVVKMIRSGG